MPRNASGSRGNAKRTHRCTLVLRALGNVQQCSGLFSAREKRKTNPSRKKPPLPPPRPSLAARRRARRYRITAAARYKRSCMTRDVLIFANPIAGRGRGRVIAERLAGRLAAEGFRPTLLLERADQVKRDQLDPEARAAIVIGGDGTVRSVAKCLFYQTEQGQEGPPLLIVPMG